MRATSMTMTRTRTTTSAVRGACARTRGGVAAHRGSAHVARAGKKMDGPYEARNEFVIPSGDGGVVGRFEEEMRVREKLAKECGAMEAKLVMMKTNEYAFEQKWATKEAYEAYMNTPQRRRSHLTVGVYQRLPKDKWSVPDNFTPVTKA
jgi:quinol monooxygenase YgiN